MIRHDSDLASTDLYVRDEACARLADFWFCEHPDCDVYTDDRAELDRDLFCTAHSKVGAA
jgi:hypothetical protein